MSSANRKARASLLVAALAVPIGYLVAQSPGSPRLRVTSIPEYRSDSLVRGEVSVSNGQPSDYWVGVYIFVPDVGWFSRPGGCFSQLVPDANGQFQADITQVPLDNESTDISIYLFPKGFSPPCVEKATVLPFALARNALTVKTYHREPASLRKIRFSGLDWYVKTSVVPTGPGPATPNYFLDSEQNVYVDSFGKLHLRISRCGDTWCSSEIFSDRTLGFGNYRIALDTDSTRLDENAVLGMFTWNHQSDSNNREIDIELSKWGQRADTNNAQYVIQPYDQPGNRLRFAIPPGSAFATHQINWGRNSVSFSSIGASGQSIRSWSYANNGGVPSNGFGTQFHLNLYLNNNTPPASRTEQEVVISSFSFSPLSQEVSFLDTESQASFAAQTLGVPVDTFDQSCQWSIISNTPWIDSIDPTGSGRGIPRIRLEENTGTQRIGSIQLDSRNCNISGRSTVRIVQAVPDCSITFTPKDLLTDFRAKLETIGVAIKSSACSVSVSASAPWIQIARAPVFSQQGTATFDVAITENEDVFRSGGVRVNSDTLPVFQDAGRTIFLSTPSPASGCLTTGVKPVIGIFASSPMRLMQVRVGSLQGTVVGDIDTSGLITLGNWVQDGDQFYLTGRNSPGDSPTLLATTRVAIRNNCNAISAASASQVLDGASFTKPILTPNSIASLFGANLSSATVSAPGGLITPLNGISLGLCGVNPKLFYVSPSQINFLVPNECRPGRYRLTLNEQFVQDVAIVATAPSLFVINGGDVGVPLGFATIIENGEKREVPLFTCSGQPVACGATKLDLRNASELYMVMYATGVGNAPKERILARLGNEGGEVLFAGPHPAYPGLDQVNILFRKEQFRHGVSFLRITGAALTSNGAVIDIVAQ